MCLMLSVIPTGPIPQAFVELMKYVDELVNPRPPRQQYPEEHPGYSTGSEINITIFDRIGWWIDDLFE